MANPRTTHKRRRRMAGLRPSERAFLTGEPVPSAFFGVFFLRLRPFNDADRDRRLALVERYADLIPEHRRPVIERWVRYWRGELRLPSEVGDLHAGAFEP